MSEDNDVVNGPGSKTHKTLCCGYKIDNTRPVVMWNEFNGVVQCHNCGHVYVPRQKLELAEVALQMMAARESNPNLLRARKNAVVLTDVERIQQAESRARKAMIAAKAFLNVLEREMPF